MEQASAFATRQILLAGEKGFASKEAEESVLFSFLTSNRDLAENIDAISENDFYIEDYGKIFRAIKIAYTKGAVDLVTVDAVLTETMPEESGKLSNAMVQLINTSFHPANVSDYIRIVKELSARRQTLNSVQDILNDLRDPTKELSEILNKLRTEGQDIELGGHEWKSMTDVMLDTYEYLSRRAAGEERAITTGIVNVDSLIGGFYGGELTIIGARPSVGKSAFGANIAMQAAKKGYKVGICSREMTDVQFGQRILSYETLIDGMRLRKAQLEDDDWESITEVLSPLSELPISFLFTARTVEDLRRQCQKQVSKGELDILIVDYLQLMRTTQKFRDEHLRVGYISKALKDLATDLHIPVIALAQVNRDSDGQMPTLKSLKDSGSIEQDADGVIFLHRPADESDAYVDPRDREYFQMYAEKDLTYLCIGVAKQRQGAVGKACVLFDSKHMRYIPIER